MRPSRNRPHRIRHTVLGLLVVLPLAPGLASPRPLGADSFEERREALLDAVAAPFQADHCDPAVTSPTTLDNLSFQQLLELVGPKPLDNAVGWSVEARTGGRPFACLDEITVNGAPWLFDPSGFTSGDSGIHQDILDAHFAAGKTVNRLWFAHPASNGFPITLVLTPDGFLNPAGALAPMRLGSVVRTGFIGEPFARRDGASRGADGDYAQHTEQLAIDVVDNDTVRLLYDVHSQAGEGVIELELRWNPELEGPELCFRAASAPRFDALLGFVGFDFLRGPTLSGRLNEADCSQNQELGGIEAFHDSRTAFLVRPGRPTWRSLLVPPVTTGAVERQDPVVDVPVGSRLIVDQPQGVARYFSKCPEPPYQSRTDLVLELTGATPGPIRLRRAQVSVDLGVANPEALETANLFLAAPMRAGLLSDLSYRIDVAAHDFEAAFPEVRRGVVFVSDQAWDNNSLYFLPLSAALAPVGPAERLTDAVISDPRRPSATLDGRYILFDADDYRRVDAQRIYLYDLWRATARRQTVDPHGSSFDHSATASPDGLSFAFVTNRRGSTLVWNIEDMTSGLGPGFGVYHECEAGSADDPDWSPSRSEVALVCGSELLLVDLKTGSSSGLVTRSGLRSPDFSRDGERLAYAAAGGIYLISRDGSDETLILDAGEHPSWASPTSLIVELEEGGERDLFSIDLDTDGPRGRAPVRLTPLDGSSAAEPTFVLPALLFSDGFESGDDTAWSASFP